MARKKYKYTADELDKKEYDKIPFEGEWAEVLGVPERRGTWLIWGASFNGKTTFALRLAKYICELGEKVAFLSLEMKASKSMQMALRQVGMRGVGKQFSVWVGMDKNDLIVELSKQRSPQVIFIDSVQYLGINTAGYKQLVDRFPNKVFVFISQSDERGNPKGKCADAILYYADVKIKVEQFMAKCNSRYGGGKIYTIWEEGAQRMAEGSKFLTDNMED